jgi:hypothetical protein
MKRDHSQLKPSLGEKVRNLAHVYNVQTTSCNEDALKEIAELLKQQSTAKQSQDKNTLNEDTLRLALRQIHILVSEILRGTDRQQSENNARSLTSIQKINRAMQAENALKQKVSQENQSLLVAVNVLALLKEALNCGG